MDWENLALGDSIKNLKCSQCPNYLSFFPIYLSNNTGNICGRCYDSILEKNNYIRNEAYETIAQFTAFPCRYKKQGCQEKFKPTEMANHEQACPYRLVECPTVEFSKCNWKGAQADIVYHCHTTHSDIMLQNGQFDINLSQSLHSYNLFELSSILFIITRKFYAINKLLELSICHVEGGNNTKSYNFEAHFKSTKRTLIIQCNAERTTEIFLDSLKNTPNDVPTVNCCITLQKNETEGTVVENETVNRHLLSFVECGSCHNYALPPIYQTASLSGFLVTQETNNVLCHDCATTCNNKDGNIFSNKHSESKKEMRNYALEKYAHSLIYPCKNEKTGCCFVAKAEIMKNHRAFCPYGQYPCPLAQYINCKWLDCGRNVTTHIQDVHKDMFKEMSDIHHFSLYPPTVKCYIIKFADKLFQLTFFQRENLGKNSFCWSLQVIGENEETYTYELEIVNGYKSLMVRGQSSAWQKKDQILMAPTFNCFVMDQLKAFLQTTDITFKIKILKN